MLSVVAGTAIGLIATGCTVWEKEWTEIHPLPETEIPVTPDPWEAGGTDEKPVFE